MKNVLNVVKATVGTKNAMHVIKVADLNGDNGQLHFNAAVDFLMAGKSVGIQPLTPVNKKEHIEEAKAWVQKINETIDALVGRTHKPKKEANGMKGFQSRDEWAEAQVHGLGKQKEMKPIDRAYRNQSVGVFQSHAQTVAQQRYLDIGEFEVEVEYIELFNKPKVNRYHPDWNPQLGIMQVRLPRGYAVTRWREKVNGQLQTFWEEFGDFMLDQRKSADEQFNPAAGSGELILVIKENKQGQAYVTLPKGKQYIDEFGKKQYPDRLRTRDVRFPDNEPQSFNNANLEAALTAYVRFFWGEFVQANPMNRHGIDESCITCKNVMYVPGYDNMDNEASGYKNTLNTNDTIEMVQWGQEIPRRFCMVQRELVDLEGVKQVNEALQREETHYFNEEGHLTALRPGEVIMHGRGVHRLTAIKESTYERCSVCPHYHNNAPKTEQQIGKEKADGAQYVSKYWSEDARPERMAIQTLVHNGKHSEWVNQYPGEVENPIEFRVYSIGGLAIYGIPEINDFAVQTGVLNQIPFMEEVNEAEAYAAKVVNYAYQVCRRLSEATPERINHVTELLQTMPEGISDRMERRWLKAVEYMQETILNAQNEDQE